MKYILEVLGGQNSGSSYSSRAAAIRALDSFSYHRPGQPIAAVYINDSGLLKALLAIGHDYGVGLNSSNGTRRYTIIGDCDGSHSVTASNWASEIRLSEIPYSNLLALQEAELGIRRFGYLGTEFDSWASVNGGQDKVPNGATVQEAFEHILLGDLNKTPTEDSLTLTITASPNEVVEGEADSYTITVAAIFSGTMTSASLSASEGSIPNPSEFLSSLIHGAWTNVYTADFSSMTTDSKTITYTATATVGSIQRTASATVTLRKRGVIPPDPQVTYRVVYHAVNVCTGSDLTDVSVGSIPSIRGSFLPSGWSVEQGWHFAGWTKNSDGSEPIVSGLSESDFGSTSEENVKVCNLYSHCEADIPEQSILRITASQQTETYSGSLYTYNYQSHVTVIGNGATQPITWNSDGTGTGDGFTVSFMPADNIPSETDAGTYTGTVGITVTDTDRWTLDGGSTANAVLKINPRPASIAVKLNGQSSLELAVGSTRPTESFVPSEAFIEADRQALSNITANWGTWNPELNMDQPRSYTLSFTADLSSYINTSNYTITKTPATLTVKAIPLEVIFNTDTGSGRADHPAKKATSVSSISRIDHWSTIAVPNSVTGIENWWVIFVNNTDLLQSTTTVHTNKPVNITGVKYWDATTSKWGNRSTSSVNPLTGTDFEYSIQSQGLVTKEKCYIALNITEI